MEEHTRGGHITESECINTHSPAYTEPRQKCNISYTMDCTWSDTVHIFSLENVSLLHMVDM